VKAKIKGHEVRLLVDPGTRGLLVYRNRLRTSPEQLHFDPNASLSTAGGTTHVRGFQLRYRSARLISAHATWHKTKQRTWAGAERVKAEMRAARDGSAVAAEEVQVTVAQAIDMFLAENIGQELSAMLRELMREALGLIHSDELKSHA
jgi:hypothetical protein